MTPSEYTFLSDFLLEKSGLALGPAKEYLLEARLIPIAQSWGLSNLTELVQELQKKNNVLETAVMEAMTTNETSFFRDTTPFDDLRRVILPAVLEARRSSRTLRVWCAAASSGQEPYSFLMLCEDAFPELGAWNFEFVATDISSQILVRAEAGVYTQFEIQRGLPIQMLLKHFEQTPAGWQVKSHLRKRVRFRTLNLLQNFSHLGTFDIIMCRNVMIYFDAERKREIFERLHRAVRPDGYLMLGAAETVLGLTDRFERCRTCTSAVYGPSAPATTARSTA
jgi:chemotaxis protein methyltransferase CheR